MIPSGLLQTIYMVFHILTLNFKIKVHYNTYRYFQSHTTHVSILPVNAAGA